MGADSDEQINLTPADTDKYNIEALKNDIQKDQRILDVIISCVAHSKTMTISLKLLASYLPRLSASKRLARRYSSLATTQSTIKYLSEKLPSLISTPDFGRKSAFVSGESKSQVEDIVKRFSPISKTGESIDEDQQIDYLFATDV